MEKLVSVIIPAYNHQQFIKDCIESIINQTYKNLEIIIQDDCSTDHTVREIKKIKDKRIKLILSKKNQGVVNTLNDLIKFCNGEYIAVIGSDDIWNPTKIEKQINVFKKNPDLGCVFTDIDIIDENGNLYQKDEHILNNNPFNNRNMKKEERIRLFYEKGNCLCHPSSMIPKKVIQKIGDYNKSYRQLHDYDYWIRLINNYDIYIIEEKLMKYRIIRNNNISISCTNNRNIIRTMNELYNINSNLILNMDNELFVNTFKSRFKNKSSKSEEELICEKYFLLLELKIGGSINKSYAYSLIFNYDNKNKLFDILKNKFNYTLNDFYQETGFISESYPIVYSEEYNNTVNCYLEEISNLQNQINKILNSRSWKITKPLRFITGLYKKMKRVIRK